MTAIELNATAAPAMIGLAGYGGEILHSTKREASSRGALHDSLVQ